MKITKSSLHYLLTRTKLVGQSDTFSVYYDVDRKVRKRIVVVDTLEFQQKLISNDLFIEPLCILIQTETNVRKSYVKSDFSLEKVDKLIEIFKGT